MRVAVTVTVRVAAVTVSDSHSESGRHSDSGSHSDSTQSVSTDLMVVEDNISLRVFPRYSV